MALSARNQQILAADPVLRIPEDSDHGSCDLARDVKLETAYNQQAFRYFLANERKRSEVSNRPFLLLLLDLQQTQTTGRIHPSIATRLFAGLAECLRDTDVIGWYHEGRVAGAVLTQVEDASATDMGIRTRVTTTLRMSLPASVSARLQVRVYQLPAGPTQ
jgi:hypothetical protein